MREILIVVGGYTGFNTAWKLDKQLRRSEAQVIAIDPSPYMTYQPLPPEVMAGSIEPRHSVMSLRKHLRRTEVVAGTVISVDHSNKRVIVCLALGSDFDFSYDIVFVTTGAVTHRHSIYAK